MVTLSSCYGSKDPKERAKVLEIQRLAEAWMERLMERFPELAIQRKPVPDERNGFLKWLEFADRLKDLSPGDSASIKLAQPLSDYLAGKAPWDPAAAREWLAANSALMRKFEPCALYRNPRPTAFPWTATLSSPPVWPRKLLTRC
ncbi:MAG: hypothetical protein EOP87_23365 [Verrucomicrobiaceae bacterium]|nr:MAG: hypothetical protein EOP87_23365 [Verrucomicrobiaceae bacterium]